jgi:peptidoglycan/LPS O-acetylase OafA/YrhL
MTRIRHLDGLRGVLALIVFAHHFLWLFSPSIAFGGTTSVNPNPWSFSRLLAHSPLNAAFNSLTAIMCFFLLSGFVQSYSYFRHPERGYLARSFIRRYFRLAVPVLAVVLIVYLFHVFGFIRKDLLPQNPLTNAWAQSQLPGNLTLLKVVRHGLFDCFLNSSGYYQVLWTIQIELIASWVMLIALFVTHGIRYRLYIMVAWLLVQTFVLRWHYGHAFTAGVIICELYVTGRLSKLFASRTTRMAAYLIGIYLASFPFVSFEGVLEQSVYSWMVSLQPQQLLVLYTIGLTMVMAALLRSELIGKVLRARAFLFLGKISFMFYLSHFLILTSLTPWLYQAFSAVFPLSVNLLASAIGSLALIVFTSRLLHVAIESPVLRLTRKLARNGVKG